jgi:ABC-type glycerol-3-phosphate transport system permease component
MATTSAAPAVGARGHRRAVLAFRYVLLSLGSFVALLPFLYMIATSLKSYGETITRVSAIPFHPDFWPQTPVWSNYVTAWSEVDLGHYFLNSVIIGAITATGATITSSMSAYAFAKMRFKGRDFVFGALLGTLMIPETVLLIPNFIVVSALGWVDRLAALTVPFIASAFDIFLLRQFFNQIPNALLESARMDGASHRRLLTGIVAPLARGPLATVAFLSFLGSWNALQWPLVVTQTPRWRPIAVGLTRFIAESGPETQLRMAGATIALVPVVVVYILAQKQITEAISRTGIKG